MQENVNYQFLEAYQMLNPAQKKAVDTIHGPVLVVAGPGTGKTQILAARIGNILKEGQCCSRKHPLFDLYGGRRHRYAQAIDTVYRCRGVQG